MARQNWDPKTYFKAFSLSAEVTDDNTHGVEDSLLPTDNTMTAERFYEKIQRNIKDTIPRHGSILVL